MRIHVLELNAFRNIAHARIEPGPGINYIFGANGQGKTNLVEAVTFLSWLRSFRTSRTADIVQRDREAAAISASIENREGVHEVEVSIGCGIRKAVIAGHAVRSVSETISVLTVMCLSPDDTAVLDGGPDGRRGLMDRMVVLLNPGCAPLFRQYAQLVRERNVALRMESGGWDREAMTACEEAIATCGAQIVRLRLGAISELTRQLPEALDRMSGSDHEVRVGYSSRWLNQQQEIERELLESLVSSRQRDAAVGYTTVGPHTDDIEVEMHGLRARGHASRGQKKALMLAWKAAEAESFWRARGEYPVLVLDDALADLDKERQERVIAYLNSYPGQSFVTSAVFQERVMGKVFNVEGGVVMRRDAGE